MYESKKHHNDIIAETLLFQASNCQIMFQNIVQTVCFDVLYIIAYFLFSCSEILLEMTISP